MNSALESPKELGQALPITALFMAALLLFAALAIDVTSVLSAERFYTTTADAAALAGAQDLQEGKTRKVTDADRQAAREHALHVLAGELGATSADTCDTTSDITDCPLPDTPYLVSIVTPAPHCDRCDTQRAVKVTVRHPAYPLTFANLAGQNQWNVESSAVAGIDYPGKYALISLKPQGNYDTGVVLNGSGTTVVVENGDIGTNTHLIEEPGQVVFSDSAQWIYHYNPTAKNGKLGFDPESLGRQLTSYIEDPMYDGPDWSAAEVFEAGQADPDALADSCPSEVTALGQIQDLESAGVIESTDDVLCYRPGVYAPGKGVEKQFIVQNGEVAYFLPGAYLFEGGLDVNNGGYVFGGLVDTERGVLFSTYGDKEMDLEGATEILLNTAVSGPPLDSTGTPMITEPPDELMVTFYVPRDASCFESEDSPVPIDAKACSADENATIKLAGSGALHIAGVVYAPTERISIRGNSDTDAIDGQIVGWTLEWSGDSTLRINYPDFEQLGILRLDGACTGSLTGPGDC